MKIIRSMAFITLGLVSLNSFGAGKRLIRPIINAAKPLATSSLIKPLSVVQPLTYTTGVRGMSSLPNKLTESGLNDEQTRIETKNVEGVEDQIKELRKEIAQMSRFITEEAIDNKLNHGLSPAEFTEAIEKIMVENGLSPEEAAIKAAEVNEYRANLKTRSKLPVVGTIGLAVLSIPVMSGLVWTDDSWLMDLVPMFVDNTWDRTEPVIQMGLVVGEVIGISWLLARSAGLSLGYKALINAFMEKGLVKKIGPKAAKEAARFAKRTK